MKQLTIRNNSHIKYVAKQIAKANNRGFATAKKVRTILNVLRNEFGIKNLKNLNENTRERFIDWLKNQGYNSHTTATYVSAFNRVAEYAEKPDLWISAKEYGLEKGSFEYVNRAAPDEAHRAFVAFLEQKAQATGDVRYEALKHSVELQRTFGLRASESFGIKITEKNLENQKLSLNRHDLTKNGRPREVPVFNTRQVEVFNRAKSFAEQHGWRSLIAPDHSKSQWVNFAYKALNEFRSSHPEHKDYSFHAERHAFAQEYYSFLKEQKQRDEAEARLDSMLSQSQDQQDRPEQNDRETDREIRREISEALGHSREEVTSVYVGK